MKRLALILTAAALLVISVPGSGDASGPFDQKLPQDRQIIHALNRLTFGPRPGEVEEVRRVGLTKWIEFQLHPDRIPENPLVEEKLKPLETLRLDQAAIMKDYAAQPLALALPNVNSINTLLNGDQMRKVLNGTAEERTTVLKALDPEKRLQVLAVVPPTVLEFTPEFKKEGEEARKMQQENLQKQLRQRNPQLTDLLTPDQRAAATSGNREKIEALMASLDPEKRAQVASLLPQQSLAAMPELRRFGMVKRQPRNVPSQDLKEAKVFRAVYSNRQLEEVLVDFWVNHFNVDINKTVQQTPGNQVGMVIGSYERDAIRPHVLGHFKDLLLATARHPAMLYYLDNWQSMANNSFDVGPFAPQRGIVNGVPNSILPNAFNRQAHGLNENYGREVMELHTLGVKGGYTQDDVIAVARCFTGWTVRDPINPEFTYAAFMHDSAEKVVLGKKIPAGGGEDDGLRAIDILAHHPSTAKFISRELAQRFVADDPPQALVDKMAQTFTKTDGDLRAVLSTMFSSTEFLSEGAWLAKVKSPFEVVVSAVRAGGGEVTDAFSLVQRIADLGQPLYNKLEPTGYPNIGDSWLSTTGIVGRMNFGVQVSNGNVPGVKLDQARIEGKEPAAIARDLLGREPSAQTQAAIDAGVNGKVKPLGLVAGLVFGSPYFQRR
jgi:uncharacterized protein (DUF1800 family)